MHRIQSLTGMPMSWWVSANLPCPWPFCSMWWCRGHLGWSYGRWCQRGGHEFHDCHYYITVNCDSHFTFTAAGIRVRHEWKVTVNRGLTVAGACARCGKWNYRRGQHKVPAVVNPINRSGHLMLPVAVNDLKRQKKNLDRPTEPIQGPDEPIHPVAAAARETLAPPVQGRRRCCPWIRSNPPSHAGTNRPPHRRESHDPRRHRRWAWSASTSLIWLMADPSPDLEREKEEQWDEWKREGDGRKRSSSGVPHVDTKGDLRLGAFPAVDLGSIRATVLLCFVRAAWGGGEGGAGLPHRPRSRRGRGRAARRRAAQGAAKGAAIGAVGGEAWRRSGGRSGGCLRGGGQREDLDTRQASRIYIYMTL